MLVSKKIILLVLVCVSSLCEAQRDYFTEAYNLLNNKKLDSAKICIDKAVNELQSSNVGVVWYLHGFIYKELYKRDESNDPESSLRIIALNSFKTSMIIDSSIDYLTENRNNIKYLTATLNNDAVKNLDSLHYPTAIKTFERYKEYYNLVDTTDEGFKQTNIKFLLALSTVYSQILERDRKGKIEFLKLAKDINNEVLNIEPNNRSANYNMAMLCYGQAVNLINQADYSIDIIALNDLQDNSVKLFRESLPFMEKAYTLDPKRKETILGLTGIYFSLNEFEKSNIFKHKLEELEK